MSKFVYEWSDFSGKKLERHGSFAEKCPFHLQSFALCKKFAVDSLGPFKRGKIDASYIGGVLNKT